MIVDKLFRAITKGKKVDDPTITKTVDSVVDDVDGVVDDVVTPEQADALRNTGEAVIDDAVENIPFVNKGDRIEDALTKENKLSADQIKQQAILNGSNTPELAEFKEGVIDYKNFDAGEIKVVNEMYESFLKGDTDTYDGPLAQWFDSTDGVGEGNYPDLVNNMTDALVTKYEKGSFSNDDLLKYANSLDSIEVFNKIRDKKPGEILDVPIYLRGLIESDILYKKSVILQDRIMTGQSKDFQLYYKLLTQQMALLPSLKDSISNSARSLQVSNNAIKRNPNYSQDVNNIMKAFENGITNDEEGIEFVSAIAYLNKRESAAFPKELDRGLKSKDYTSGIKTFRDMWLEAWINTRLSSPITHMVNTLGNLGFIGMRTTEIFGAAAINKIPLVGSRDGVMFNEAFGYVRGMGKGLMLGARNAKTSIITGVPTGADGLSKLDMPVKKAIHSSNLPDYMTAGKYNITGIAFNTLGTIIRIPGRLLITGDELAKGVIYRQELERHAIRAGNRARFDIEDAIKNGVLEPRPGEVFDLKTAGKQAFDRAYLNSMKNPTSETVDSIKNSMSEGTFQADLPGPVFNAMNQVLNNPNLKFVVPFHKTVMNIFREVGKRNPIMALAMPTVYKELGGSLGPVARQTAVAKLGLGTGLMTAFGLYAYGQAEENSDFTITGMAPIGKKEREAFYRKGFQPYSIAYLDKNTGLYNSRSYSRFDPLSPLLAISADVAYLMGRSDVFSKDNHAVENALDVGHVFITALAAVMPYLLEQPFAVGIQKLASVMTPNYGDAEQGMGTILNNLSQLLMEPTVGMVNFTGSFGGWLQRQSDPKMYDVNATSAQMLASRNIFDGDTPEPIRQFYKTLNNAMLNNPFFNTDLTPKLNLWGREIERKQTLPLSPFRISEEKYNVVDDAMLKYGIGITMPAGTIKGIKLSSDEYYEYILAVNKDDEFLDAMKDLVQKESFKNLLNVDKAKELNALKTIYVDAGKRNFLASPKGRAILTMAEKAKVAEEEIVNSRGN